MYSIKRNQIIITALVVMIAVAGYLSLAEQRMGEDDAPVALLDDSDITGVLMSNQHYFNADIHIVEGSIAIAMDGDEEAQLALASEEPGAAVFVNTLGGSTYFVQAKLEREQVRSRQTQTLKDMINNQNLEQDQRAEFANSILELQKRIEMEAASESMIESRGFAEAYVRINDSTVDVVVSKESLSAIEIAQIEDIIKRQTGKEVSQIRISPLSRN